MVALAAVAVLVYMEVQGIANHYELRVTSDTPTFLALIRDMALHPLHPVSVFLGTPGTNSIHASPYLQVLALIWKAVASAKQFWSPIALGEFAAVVTIPASLFVLATVWLYVRQLAGATAAWISIPVLLALFGPAHVIYAGDMTVNGFLTTGYFPSTVAIGLLLATMVAIQHRRRWADALAVALAFLTLTSDPFAGLMLVMLVIIHACAGAERDRRELLRAPIILTVAFVLTLAWPAMNTFAAFSESGAPVPGLVIMAFLAPRGWLLVRRSARVRGLSARLLRFDPGPRLEARLAETGFWVTAALLVWAFYALGHWPVNVPVLRSYRLGFYWNDDRDRWLLLLIPGICGLVGLWRLARRGLPLTFVWFAGIFALGFVGAAVHLSTGHELPLYYRLILACQLPLAVGVAAFLVNARSRKAVLLTGVTLLATFAYKVGTLESEPTNINYFGDSLGTLWNFNRIIPRGPGLIATDPGTGYFMPVTTGRLVLTFSKGHADSGDEQNQAETGYELLRRVYIGSATQAATALRQLWRDDVRWVVVEKFTNFDPPNQQILFASPYTSLITEPDVARMARYNARLAAVSTQTYDDQEFTAYRLDERLLKAATSATADTLAPARATIEQLLRRLAATRGAPAPAVRARLAELGVKMVALSYGELDSTPVLSAYGARMSDGDSVSVPVTSGRWQVNCVPLCNAAGSSKTITGLGRVLHNDGRFSTIVELR